MSETSKRDWGSIVAGVAMIIVGFAFLLVPGLTLVAIAAIAGVALVASGVVDAISYARYRRELDLSAWMLVGAALDIVLGVLFIVHPLVSAVVLPWLAAIGFAVYGVLEIVAAWRIASAKRVGYVRLSPYAAQAPYSAQGESAGGMRPGQRTPGAQASAGSWGWTLFGGLVAIICALAFFFAPESFAFFLAFFVMIRGIVAIGHGLSMGAGERVGRASA